MFGPRLGDELRRDRVSTGSWKYSVTPAAGAWRGGQSAQGNTIVVLI
jgi:hypothetical protein